MMASDVKEIEPGEALRDRPLEDVEAEVLKHLNDGQTFLAYNTVKKALVFYPDSFKLREYGALALIRTGAVEEAKEIIKPILNQLYGEEVDLSSDEVLEIKGDGSLPSEIIALVASIFKQTWRHSRNNDDLRRSRELYQYHFEKEKSAMSGVNAASLSWLLGDDDLAQDLAQQAANLAEADKNKKSKEGFDAQMILAESHLILGDHDLALAMLNRAQVTAGDDYALIVNALHQLKLLNDGGFSIPKQMFEALHPPTIVVFGGQMIDLPGQENKRFMPELEPMVKQHIKQKLDEIDAKIGYTSASCGSDILFIEAMLERGAEVNVILPFEKEDFIANNVRYAGPRWEARFHRVLEKVTTVSFATDEKFLGHEMLYRFANLVLHGMAEMRGNFLLSPPHLITVWDSQPDSLVGGAGDSIDHWSDIKTLHIVDLDDIKSVYLEQTGGPGLPAHLKTIRQIRSPASLDSLAKTPRIIKTMLFSDLAGFSKLKEEHIPGFLTFLAELKQTMEKMGPIPESINTWGDAIFAVMNDATALAEYALLLSELVPEISRNTRGLPPINIRVSLHAGPVYESIDPFRLQRNYYGGHINRAARLEPVTVIGEVYSTEQFMALLTAEQSAKRVEMTQQGLPYVERFTCEYVGVVSLAKGFGVQPVYHLRWL